MHWIFKTFASTVVGVNTYWLVTDYLYWPIMCSGPSMLPTLFPNDVLILDRISPRFISYQRGELVGFKSPHEPGNYIVKRVIALPGDVVCIDPRKSNREYLMVPQGHCWLGGDNYEESIDSRVYGPIPLGLIIGRFSVKLFPEVKWLANGYKESLGRIESISPKNFPGDLR